MPSNKKYSLVARRVKWRTWYAVILFTSLMVGALYAAWAASPEATSLFPPFRGEKIGELGSVFFRVVLLVFSAFLMFLVVDFGADIPNPRPFFTITDDGVWIRGRMKSQPVPWKLIKSYHFGDVIQNYGLFRLSHKYLEFECEGHAMFMKKILSVPFRPRLYLKNLDAGEQELSAAVSRYINEIPLDAGSD